MLTGVLTGHGIPRPDAAAGDTGIITIEVTEAQIRALDLTSARAALQVGQGDDWAQRLMTRTVDFRLAFEQEETDPRELCVPLHAALHLLPLSPGQEGGGGGSDVVVIWCGCSVVTWVLTHARER